MRGLTFKRFSNGLFLPLGIYYEITVTFWVKKGGLTVDMTDFLSLKKIQKNAQDTHAVIAMIWLYYSTFFIVC